ncbi:ABC transporter ATP-binding protein [Thermodesulfobacteriota bacterium]
MLLEIKDLFVAYDTAVVLDGVSFGIEAGEFVSIVGPNGAGKSTLLRTISGLMHWEKDMVRGMRKEISNIIIKGEIFFDGEQMQALAPDKRVKKGLILCPERGRPFREMSIYDNLRAAGYLCDKEMFARNLDRVYDLFPVLKERAKQISGTLSGGQRTMLSIARALMPEPKILLIDEPSTGLAPLVKNEMFKRVEDIYQAGTTILLVEQDVTYAFKLARRNYVLSKGRIVAGGTAKELIGDEKIRKVYLGL